MTLKSALARLEALADERNKEQAEYDHRAASAAFDAAVRQIPDGDHMARALARRMLGHDFSGPWDRSVASQLSEAELRQRLAPAFAAMRAFRPQ